MAGAVRAIGRHASTASCFSSRSLVYALWPKNRAQLRRRGPHAAARGLSDEQRPDPSRQDFRSDHHRPRVGRHPRAQYAAAALVAVSLLPTIAFSVVYWFALSGLAAGQRATRRACSATPTGRGRRRPRRRGQSARMQQAAGLEKASLAQIAADPKLWSSRSPRAKRRSATIALPVTAQAAKASTAIRT